MTTQERNSIITAAAKLNIKSSPVGFGVVRVSERVLGYALALVQAEVTPAHGSTQARIQTQYGKYRLSKKGWVYDATNKLIETDRAPAMTWALNASQSVQTLVYIEDFSVVLASYAYMMQEI